MKISKQGLEFIQDVEGTRYTAYLDGGGVWTIGVGHTGPDVVQGLRATDEQVLAWLAEDTGEAEDAVNKYVNVPLSQNQFDALVSFTFNLGGSALKTSTLLKKLNAGDYMGAKDQFQRWNKDNGKIVAGLTKRRLLEASMFEA